MRGLVSVIIPTLNAGPQLRRLLELLWEQTVKPFEVLIIDSSSTDETIKIAESLDARIMVIAREDFDHGATRNLGADATSGDIMVFLTQDAIPRDNRVIEKLTNPLRNNSDVALSYGRHIPKAGTAPLERFIRSYSYTAKPSIKDASMLTELGIRTFTCSNVCAAVKRSVFIEAGKFPERTIMNEDLILSAKLILKGHKVVYEPAAAVFHSHDYSLREQFGRYFDIGVSLSRERWILDYAKPGREGLLFLKQEIGFLMKEKKASLIPYAIIEAAAKYIAYRLGLAEKRMPISCKKRLSMHTAFWDREREIASRCEDRDSDNVTARDSVRKKVLHVVEAFGSGVFYFMVDLVQGTPEYDHTIIYGLRNETPGYFKDFFPPGTKFYFWMHAGKEVGFVKEFRAFVELMKQMKRAKPYDVVHLHSSKAGFHGRIACRLLGTPVSVIYSPHGAPFLRKDISRHKADYYAFLENVAARCGGQIICGGATESAAFRERGMKAIHINNGVACDEVLHSFSPGARAIVATAGRIAQQKNPALFNELAKAFVSDPSIRFVWFGDGELRHILSSPNIEITGWLTKEELLQRLRQIDIYLSTSLWEGLPLSVLLAMCAGKPVVLSDCVGNRELAEHGRGGFLFSQKDEALSFLEKLRSDKELAQNMGNASHQLLLANYQLKSMIWQYSQVYAAISKANARCLSG